MTKDSNIQAHGYKYCPFCRSSATKTVREYLLSRALPTTKICHSPEMRSKASYLLLPLFNLMILVSTMPLDNSANRAPPEVENIENIEEPSTSLTVRQYQPFLYTCSGYAGSSPAGDGGCGGPCTKQYYSCPSNSVPSQIYCPNTNCVDTDGNTPFYVCDGDNSCNPQTSFHPTQDREGRSIFNTRGTMYLYVTSC